MFLPQSTHFNLRHLVLLTVLFAFTGCGRIAFVSERYDNFTAYYNTFYNAEKSYSEGIEALEQTAESIDRRVFISIFEPPGQSSNDQRFGAAINKSADVLREHPESKWVDDALLLIGKSYFYLQNFVGAEQKFQEVLALASPLEDEARLWMARTLIAAGAYDEAREHLVVSLEREGLSRRWEPSLRLALGELHVKRADYEAAVAELAAGLENVRDNRYRARASFLHGQVLERIGRYEEAVAAYERVLDAHPRYELSYAALYSAVRVQGIHVDADEALHNLRRMERDDKHYSNRYELAYLRGRIYQSRNYADDALSLYHEILYDSEGQITNLRGRVHYALGELYRDLYRDYETASAYFDTARTAMQPPAPAGGARRAADVELAPEAITDAEALSEMFGSFADVRGQIAEMDSLLYLGRLDDEEFTAKILEIRRKLAEEMAETERRAARLEAERGFQNAAASGGSRPPASSSAAAAASSSEGFLFHLDPVRVQEGRMNFLSRWGERPLAPNWRRIDAVANVAALTDSAGVFRGRQVTDLNPSVGENPLPPIDYSNVPRDSLTQAAMRARRAAARYELANVLFLLMDKPDSAATWYRAVIEEDAEFPVAQRAFYALAEVHSSLGDSLAARRLYEQVLQDYPTSDFAGRVRERLGIREDVPSDTLALAEEEYDLAYQRWHRGSYQRALDHMVEVAATYPRLEVAPRALLAAGHIYMEWAQRDSMDIFGQIPFTVSDSTLQSAGILEIKEAAPPPTDNADLTDEPLDERLDDSERIDAPAGEALAPVDEALAPADEALAPADESFRPPSKGRAAEVPSKDIPGHVPDDELVVRDVPPRGGAHPPDSTALQQQPDAVVPPQREPDTIVPVQLDPDATPPDQREPDAAIPVQRNPDVASSDQKEPDAAVSVQREPDAAPPAHEMLVDAPDSVSTDADRTNPSEDLTLDPDIPERVDAADSVAAVPVDSSAADATPARNAAVADAPPIANDTTPVANDSTVVARADTTDREMISPVIEDEGIYLKTIYDGVKRNYPQTAYATQADLFLKALEEKESELQAAADSVAAALAAAADSAAGFVAGNDVLVDSLGLGADSLAHLVNAASADSSFDAATAGGAQTEVTTADAGAGAADSLSAPSEVAEFDGTGIATDSPENSEAVDPTSQIPIGEDAIRGSGGIRKELGGYTLVIGRDAREPAMRALARKYADRGFRTDVISQQVADETIYRAVLGHFASQQEAGALLQKHLTEVEESVHLAPLSDFQ